MKLKNVLRVAKRVFVKRKYKDILFRFVFREPKELLELYNAMNHTDYTNPEDLIITTMEDVVYMGTLRRNCICGCQMHLTVMTRNRQWSVWPDL